MNYGQNTYIMLSNKTKLYINGCSYTAGNRLEDNEIWPTLLANKTNLELINQSANGQSIDSIFTNTISTLSMESSDNIVAVIGLTWETRYGLFYNKGTFNITPADLTDPGEKPKTIFEEKYSTWRRLVSPYTYDQIKLNKLHKEISKDCDKFNKALYYFTRYYECLIDSDINLKFNQKINVLSKILALQAWLKQNKIEYLMADFVGYTYPRVVREPNDEIQPGLSMQSKLDNSRIIDFADEDFRNKYKDKDTAHPSAEGCEYITNKIYEKLNEL